MEVRSLSHTASALKTARLAAGHENASAFAKLIDLAPNSVYRLERGDLRPSAETLVRWADACGVSVDALADAACHDDTEEPATSSKPTVRDGIEAMVAAADKAAKNGHAA